MDGPKSLEHYSALFNGHHVPPATDRCPHRQHVAIQKYIDTWHDPWLNTVKNYAVRIPPLRSSVRVIGLIPARNEEFRIQACLSAIGHDVASSRMEDAFELIILENGQSVEVGATATSVSEWIEENKPTFPIHMLQQNWLKKEKSTPHRWLIKYDENETKDSRKNKLKSNMAGTQTEYVSNEEIEHMEDEAEDDSEEMSEEAALLHQQMNEDYGAPIPDEKHNQHTFLHKAAYGSEDTVKTTFLTEQELGRPLFPVRFLMNLRDMASDENLSLISDYYTSKIKSITTSGMSNKGFVMILNVTQKRDATKMRVRDLSNLKNQKEKGRD